MVTTPERTERHNVTRLVRVAAVFFLIPTVTIGGVMLLDPATRSDHWLHASGFALIAVLALLAFAIAPRIAAHFVAENT